MKLIGSQAFTNIGFGEIYVTGRDGSRSPFTVWVKFRDRWVSPFERRMRKWPEIKNSILMNYMLKRIYKNQPVMQVISQHNPIFGTVDFCDSKGNGYNIRTSIRLGLPYLDRR